MRSAAHSLRWSPRLQSLSAECDVTRCITFNLCALNASAGKILAHSIGCLENLFRKEEPLIFKVGFTHNPVWRWSNDLYGYGHAREKWTNMIIFHYAKEPYSPAMLEAALIDKYKSTFDAISSFLLCVLVVVTPFISRC